VYSDASDPDGDGHANTYTFEYAHPSPVPAYTYSPTYPTPTATVSFTDKSICYSTTGILAGGCKGLTNCSGGHCYTWNFGDSGFNSDPTNNPPIVYTAGDVTHVYTQSKTFASTLKICDDLGCCTAARKIPVQNAGSQDLPSWKEVSPF